MKRSLFFTLLFACSVLSAQTVTSVDANQVGKTIEITYDLDCTADISVDYSTDGGRTYKPLHRVSGDVGRGITAGHRTITWDVLSEVESLVADVSFRVNATSGKMLITLPTGQSFTMIYVEGGSFVMGCTDFYDNIAHRVMLDSYYIGETEVTQELWQAVMGSNPSYFKFKGSQKPVSRSWHDCQEFIMKLNRLTGKNFRLPTEAEWEYAARGGNKSKGYKYSGSNNVNDVAWWGYGKDSSSRTHNVKTKSPNELGIYDMSGNIREWCQDYYGYYADSPQANPTGPSSGSNRVLRGGYWGSSAQQCLVTNRDLDNPSSNNLSGFRLVLVQ